MILTNKQEEGLKIAVARYKAHEPYTCIAGYAGTGKSTLIKFIISALNISEDNIVPPPHMVNNSGAQRFVYGIGKIGDEVKLLIDPANLISDEEQELLESLH